ncbi:MAG: N-glycosylase/DNA lyase [Candidatus Hadarchaeales archaeon]
MKGKTELLEIHGKIKSEIERRLREFEKTWRTDDEKVFSELAFCLLTPQSKAKVCWETVEKLEKSRTLFSGGEKEIAEFLRPIRFWRKKARCIIEARKRFTKGGKLVIREELTKFLNNPMEAREFLVKEVKGLGYKEASHFLRNIGWGRDLAILDRHILRSLLEFGVIDEIPKNLNKKTYLSIEQKMRKFSDELGIPMSHLDFVLWYRKTGEVFK